MGNLARYDIGNNLSARIISAAQAVYECLGPGYPVEDYRRAIENELRRRRMRVQSRFPVDVWQAHELAALYFLDLFVEWQIVVEVKASRRPFEAPERDLMAAYLDAANAPMGLLINFGRRGMEYERVIP